MRSRMTFHSNRRLTVDKFLSVNFGANPEESDEFMTTFFCPNFEEVLKAEFPDTEISYVTFERNSGWKVNSKDCGDNVLERVMDI